MIYQKNQNQYHIIHYTSFIWALLKWAICYRWWAEEGQTCYSNFVITFPIQMKLLIITSNHIWMWSWKLAICHVSTKGRLVHKKYEKIQHLKRTLQYYMYMVWLKCILVYTGIYTVPNIHENINIYMSFMKGFIYEEVQWPLGEQVALGLARYTIRNI